ncbi:efflux transporter outer membrane subunit [Rhodopila sp.]|uniref:efflux transporter outer membrane subunit n=1 Tax=Rhodopila sp. TaxID=2480087 RepID=UPI003D0AD957
MRFVWACALCLAAAGCMVGPDYKRPAASTPAVFKELGDWKPSHPADAMDRGAWWSVYHDADLDRLERMVAVSNQTVKSFEAQYRSAVALVAEARASLFPVVQAGPGVTRSGRGLSGPATQYTVSGTVSWVPDIWGRMRRQVESSVANTQLNAADLAGATLSAQATLAADYFDLRAEDALMQLLSETVRAYQQSLSITQNQYRAGTSSSAAYVTALAQLQSTQAELVGVGVQRQQYEHAIAVLTGHPPAELTLAPGRLASEVPVLPPGLPSALLERRPDVASAERAMQQENALIGVQIAAYYPNITLSTLGEFAGTPLSQLFTVGSEIWQVAASGSETLFNGGFRTAAVAEARAVYDSSVASYRGTVLTAFQQVEDDLSSLRILEAQAKAEAIAVSSTRRAVDVTLNEYRAGTVAYTSVITEQTLLLSDQQSALSIQQNRLLASVSLIEALGGGWTTADLPTRGDIVDTFTPLAP